MMRGIAIASVVIWASGCSNSGTLTSIGDEDVGDGGGDSGGCPAGTVDLGGGTCVRLCSSGCLSTETCHEPTGVCLELGNCDPSLCPVDYECPEGGLGECIPKAPCIAAACPPHYVCPESGVGDCVPLENCEPLLCPPDHICPANGYGSCIPVGSCDPSACPVGKKCPANGLGDCIRDPEYCDRNLDCPLGFRCTQNHACVSYADGVVQTCTRDSQCSTFMVCQFGVCFGCIDDNQCKPYQEEARCVVGTCVTNDLADFADCLTLQCPEGERCDPTTGGCIVPCTTNAECEAGKLCNVILGTCFADPSCETSEDCGGGLSCSDTTKLCTGCNGTKPCPAGLQCFYSNCIPDGDYSICDSVTCPGQQICDDRDGTCYRENGTCTTEAQCREGQTCNPSSNLCIGCEDNGDCRPGQRCWLNACMPF